MSTFELTEIQAKAILDMRLQKLVSLEVEKIQAEYDELQEKIAYYKEILANESIQRGIIKDELDEIKAKYGDERRTDISYSEDEISIEDMIPNEEVVVSISKLGYIKRTKTSEYKAQSRGGRGSRGSKTRDADSVEHLFVADNHDYILLFTELGRCFWIRAFEIPEAGKNSAGRVIQNIVQMPKEDNVKAYIKVKDLNDEEFLNNNYAVFCTEKGLVKKTLMEQFSRPRTNGINAITLNEGDNLLEVKLSNGKNDIVIANKNGRAIRFPEEKVRSMGRTAAGVRGIRLDEGKDDEVVGMLSLDPTDPDNTIFVISEKGMGKRTSLEEYRTTNRGGKGVKNMNLSAKTGKVFAIKTVTEYDHILITTEEGIVIRTSASDLRVMGRATQGVRVINLGKKDSIADVAIIKRDENSDEEE